MRRIEVPDEGVETLFGAYDENLRHLESLFKVAIRTDGHGLLVEGEPAGVEQVEHLVGQVAALQRAGYRLAAGEVKMAAGLVAEDPRIDLRDHFLRRVVKPSAKRQAVRGAVAPRRLPCWRR